MRTNTKKQEIVIGAEGEIVVGAGDAFPCVSSHNAGYVGEHAVHRILWQASYVLMN